MPKNPFKSGGGQFTSKHSKDADEMLFGKSSEALQNIQTPTDYNQLGRSPVGFGNQLFNVQKKPRTFDFNYKMSGYNPYQFNMPTALDQKQGLFGQLLGNVQREILRNQRAAVDEQKRNAMIGGVYSPAMMKNTILGAQKQAQETMADMGAKSAFDVASEVAKYQQGLEAQQAAENLAATKFGSEEQRYASDLFAKQQEAQAAEEKAWEDLALKGGQLALTGEELGLREDEARKQYFLNLLKNTSETFIQPYASRQKSPSMFGQLLDAGAQLGSAYLSKCLPKGTPIDLEDGSTKKIEEIEIGDQVKGGEVIMFFARKRSKDHFFTRHVFEDGKEVVMTLGHPYHDKLLRTSPAYDETSPCTYDILTSSGHYYVNGVRLGSTLAGKR